MSNNSFARATNAAKVLVAQVRKFQIRQVKKVLHKTSAKKQNKHAHPVRIAFFTQVITMIALAFALAATSLWLLWLAMGRPRLSSSGTQSMTPSDIYDGVKVALTIVGGIGGVIALVVAYRKQRFAEREHDRAEAVMTREATKLFAERFRAASEQLGSDKAAVRLAGVYALADLADDWLGGRQVCIDVLCAYLRMPYLPPEPSSDIDDKSILPSDYIKEQWQRRQERQVRHTVIRVIGLRLGRTPQVSWQGYIFDFTGATFDGCDLFGIQLTGGGLNFSDAHFIGGEANFEFANFSGGRLLFAGAKFTGASVSFALSHFTGCNVEFQGAKFMGGEIDFRAANFTKGDIGFIFSKFIGGRVGFNESRFSGADINLMRAIFTGSVVDFGGAEFKSGLLTFAAAEFAGGLVSFDDARFSGSSVEFRAAHFNGGHVTIRRARAWTTPPRFDQWDAAPPGVLIEPNKPTSETQ